MIAYRVVIAMDAATVSHLTARGFLLYAAQLLPDAAPVPWLSIDAYAPTTVVECNVEYEICSGFCVPAEPGQIVVIDVNGLSVRDGGSADAVSVCNDTASSRMFNMPVIVNGLGCGALGPFTIIPKSMAVIPPYDTMLLAFATKVVDTGTVLTRTSGPVLRIDLTGAPENTRAVGYAIGTGWTWDGGTWAGVYEP